VTPNHTQRSEVAADASHVREHSHPLRFRRAAECPARRLLHTNRRPCRGPERLMRSGHL